MKKIITTILILSIVISSIFSVSANTRPQKETIPDMLYSAEDRIGNGINDDWGGALGGLENGKWENGVNKFTEGKSSASAFASFQNRISFFHNLVWPGSFIDKDPSTGVGVDMTQYKYIEFDFASEYDMFFSDFALCFCGSVDAWHGHDLYRHNVLVEGHKWYHVVMPVEDFKFAVTSDPRYVGTGIPDPAFENSETSKTICQRLYFALDGAKDPDGTDATIVYFYIDNIYGTRTETPKQKETLLYNVDPSVKIIKPGDVNYYSGCSKYPSGSRKQDPVIRRTGYSC